MTGMDFQASQAISASPFDPHQHGMKTQYTTFEVGGGLQVSVHVQDTESVQFRYAVTAVIQRRQNFTPSQDERAEFHRSVA